MIHLRGQDPGVTLCGLSVTTFRRRDGSMAQRRQPLTTTNSVGQEECDNCTRWDDSRQIKQYAADCRAAGVKVGDL